MWNWLRRKLVPMAGYQCPNRGCGSREVVPVTPIYETVAGVPWRHRPVGTVVRCPRCGEVYAVTVQGVYHPMLEERRVAPQIPDGYRRALDELVSDVRRPSAE